MNKKNSGSSKLSALCDGIVEAGWLVASVSAPLFFNVYSAGDTEFDKVALARLLATVMALAWIVRWIDQRAAPAQNIARLRAPLALPTLFLVGAYLLATFTSVVPRISLWGEYQRPEGAYAILSYALIFALIANRLRTRTQMDRLVWTILLASVPVALYALTQKFQLDPLEMTGYDGRAEASLGNPMFLGAYSMMTFFLALGKLAMGMRATRLVAPSRETLYLPALKRLFSSLAQNDHPTAQIVVYALIALLQFGAIVASASRGPFVGWLAGLLVFAMLVSAILRRQNLLRGILVLGFIALAALAALNFPGSPFARMRELPGLGRLTNLAPEPGSSADARLWYWRGVSRLVAPHAPIQFPDGAPDALNIARPFVGYGPDSLLYTFTQFYPPEMGDYGTRAEMLDRSHNETWNALATVGIFGWLAYQFLFLSICVCGLRWLGLMRSPRERNTFVGLWIGFGFAGALVMFLVGKIEYIGLGIPAGTLAAIVLYVARFGFQARASLPDEMPRADQLLLAGLLAGILAHYVEIQFGVAVVVTRTLFWMFAALIVALGARRLGAETRPAPAWRAHAATYGLIAAWMLILVLFNLVIFTESVTDPAAILWRAFTIARDAPSFAAPGLLALTLTFLVASMWTELKRADAVALAILLAVGLAALFCAALVLQLGDLARVSQATIPIQELARYANQFVNLFNGVIVGGLGLMILIALVCARENGSSRAWATRRVSWLALVAALIGAVWWNNAFNLDPARADILRRLAREYERREQWTTAAALYPPMIHLAPSEDFYFQAFGRALRKQSDTARNTETGKFNTRTDLQDFFALDAASIAGLNRNDALLAAQAMLLHARDLNPLFADHSVNLARFYLPALPVNTASKKQLVDLSDKYYAQASRLSPTNVVLLNERAQFDLDYRDDPVAALEKLNASLRLDPDFAETYLRIGAAHAAKHEWDQGIAAYQNALAREPALDTYLALSELYKNKPDLARAVETYRDALTRYPDAAKALSRLAFVYYLQGNARDAIQAYSRFIAIAPGDPNLWQAHKNLALIYKQTGDLPAAIRAAEQAAALAQDDTQTQLYELIKQWRAFAP